eukprot:jgi/Psemu1/23396/gm1.23396_g
MKYSIRTIVQLFLVVASVSDLAAAARIRGASSDYEYHSLGTTHPQISETVISDRSSDRNSDSHTASRKKRRLLRDNPKRLLKAEKSSSPSPLPTKGLEESSRREGRNPVEKEDKSSSPSPLPTKVAEMAAAKESRDKDDARPETLGSIVHKANAIRNRNPKNTIQFPITRGFGRRGDDPQRIANANANANDESNTIYKGVLGRATPIRGRDNTNASAATIATPKYVEGDRITMPNIATAKTIPRDRTDTTKKVVFQRVGGTPNHGGSEIETTTIAKTTRGATNQGPFGTGKPSTKKSSKHETKKSKSAKDEKKSKRSKTEKHRDDNKLVKQQK